MKLQSVDVFLGSGRCMNPMAMLFLRIREMDVQKHKVVKIRRDADEVNVKVRFEVKNMVWSHMREKILGIFTRHSFG